MSPKAAADRFWVRRFLQDRIAVTRQEQATHDLGSLRWVYLDGVIWGLSVALTLADDWTDADEP